MRENIRLYATLAIWFAFMVMTTVIFVAGNIANSSDPNTAVFIALILALAASVSTVAIWISGMFGSQPAEHASHAKRKRIETGRLERLVQGLDEDDIDRLEALLMDREDSRQQGSRGPHE